MVTFHDCYQIHTNQLQSHLSSLNVYIFFDEFRTSGHLVSSGIRDGTSERRNTSGGE